jgi:predicted 3-demethylubiquinone-9 3-methyltransferase (glyoxalase superfamily)
MQKITPFLAFNDQAEEAANFYISLFKDSAIGTVRRYGKEGPGPEGSVMVISFKLGGQEFFAMNGGPSFKFTEATSMLVHCENREEVDYLTEKLSEGGQKSQQGWLKDKYGLSWQVGPSIKSNPAQKITPFLWYNDQAEEAANFYTSVFKNSSIGSINRYGKEGPGTDGSVMIVPFKLSGQEFIALNGGPMYKFTEAVSMTVNCEDQEEVDYFWNKLSSDGGQEIECGWLKDKYGLFWQITPRILIEFISSEDRTKAARAFAAMLKMKKIDIATLQKAYDGE